MGGIVILYKLTYNCYYSLTDTYNFLCLYYDHVPSKQEMPLKKINEWMRRREYVIILGIGIKKIVGVSV